MNAFSHDVSGAVEAYAAYLNEDMARARAAMERAWLEATPVQADPPPAPPRAPRFLALFAPIKRIARRAARAWA